MREHLRAAIAMRNAALRGGRSHRKDLDTLRAAIGRAERFLASYPVASDERVRDWCRANLRDVTLIVPGNKPTALARLVMEAAPKEVEPFLDLLAAEVSARMDEETGNNLNS